MRDGSEKYDPNRSGSGAFLPLVNPWPDNTYRGGVIVVSESVRELVVNGQTLKAAAGYPDYFIGADGSVWSTMPRSFRERRLNSSRPRQLKPTPNSKSGYMSVMLTRDRKHLRIYVHILVLETWVGPRPEGDFQAAHDNGKRSDNRLDNLAWKTRLENDADKIRHGTRQFGEDHHAAVMTNEQAAESKRLYATGQYTYRQIADRIGCSSGTIGNLVRNGSYPNAG